MIPAESILGDILSCAFAAGLIGYVAWAFPRRRKQKPVGVSDKPDQPYTVYTKQHDLVLRGRDVPNVLATDTFLKAKGWLLRDGSIWQRKVAAARGIETAMAGSIAVPPPLDDWAICLLVDQSGSMRDDPISHTAAAVRLVSSAWTAAGACVAVLGFSTVGWHGGKSRQDWLWNGQPKRPGRLCALLHVIYKNFDRAFDDDDWAAMLHPDILRENIDGEAIAWAAGILGERSETHKALIVVSDGAPVDDTTLLHNGSAYLERHLRSNIHAIEHGHEMRVAALGVGFAVDRYYALSETVKRLEDLPVAFNALILKVINEDDAD